MANPERFTVNAVDGKLIVGLQVSEEAVVRHVVASVTWAHGTKTPANGAKSISDLQAHCQALASDEANPERVASGSQCQAKIAELWERRKPSGAPLAGSKFLHASVPLLSDYGKLPYTIPIERVLTTGEGAPRG